VVRCYSVQLKAPPSDVSGFDEPGIAGA